MHANFIFLNKLRQIATKNQPATVAKNAIAAGYFFATAKTGKTSVSV